MSFEKHSNFNKLANFSEVKFGENMPVLEVELNEMQQIQNEARADIIRDTMPSGFVTLGDIDYDYCANNDNQIKLKIESIAYVNGYRITIPKNTVIEIGEANKEREDLVFLEVWKEAVNDIDTLTEYGGENNAVINNPIKDERYPVATSQRVALKYRIRHVADLDFNKKWTSGTSSIHPYIGWNNTNSFSPIYAIGGDETITKPTSVGAYKLFRCATYDDSSYPKFSDDSGLWVAGRNDETSFEYFKNACIDGHVYAIPMFRLLRKPNVGLASPFEYKKIHNQLDPKKFAHLVGQENVEKVHSVNVKGKTFKNLLTHAKTHGNSALNINISPDIVTFDTGTSWGKIGFLVKGEPNTKYIFHCSDFYREEKSIEFYVRFSDSIHATTQTLNKIDSNTYTFTTDSSGVFMFSFEISGGVSKAYVKYPILMKYSEWEEQLRGKKIAGVKSLGELDNNSITVENNLVEEGTYVHELQNHILPTHPEVTHVSWGEDVVIPPEVEIELKRGEEVIQTITQLPVKLETTGEEKLHVKSMKGRTLVNLLNPNESVNTVTVSGGSQSWITVGSLISTLDVSKKYLVKLNVKQNTVDNLYGVYLLLRQLGVQGNTQYVPVASVVENGYAIITPDSDKTQIDSISIYAKDSVTSGSLVFDSFTIIEYQEGMENWVNKSFSGMKSVEAPSIRVTGKNLYTHQKAEVQGINKQDVVVYVPVSPNTTYTFDASAKSWATVTLFNTGGSETRLLGGVKDSQVVTFTTDSSEVLAKLSFYNGNNTNIKDVDFEKLQIQFVEGSDIPSYELGKLNELRTPKGTVLRSLPHGIFDLINFQLGTLHTNVGERIYIGDEDWIIGDGGVSGGMKYLANMNDEVKQNTNTLVISTYSDTIPSLAFTDVWNERKEGLATSNSENFGVRISTNQFTTAEEFKTWLKSHNLTVQYELNVPLTKKIGLSEDDYVGKSKVTYQLSEPLRKVGTYSDFIKGKTLYSNIGVEVLNGSEEWVRQIGTDYGFYVNHPNSIPNYPIISPQLATLNGWEGYARKGIFRGGSAIGLVVSADDLSENTLQGFKNWLKANPVTIYYVKANPMEIPLKEVSPLECDFSLNRQFKRGYENCLKELPNGVKDVVENGKVKRRTQRVTLTGNEKHEDWSVHTYVENITNTMAFRCSLNFTCDDRNKLNIVCDKFKAVPVIYFDHNDTPCIASGQQTVYSVLLRVPRSSLSSEDVAGLRLYLKNNPINLICELETSVVEELTEENCRYVPYMPLNSYVGSLYVADGINQTKFLTAFSPSGYEVQTSNRYYSNEYNLFEDIAPKKSPYGHKTVPVRITDNLHDGELYTNTGFVLNEGSYETATDWVASKNLISVVSGKTYHIKLEANDSDISSSRRYIYIYKYDSNGKYLNSRIDLGIGTQFTPDFTGKVLIVIKTKNVTHIQVTEDKAYTENIPYVIGEKFTAGLEKHEIEDLRHKVSLTGFDYSQLLQDSFLKLIKGELS